jgi:hypothetical protein
MENLRVYGPISLIKLELYEINIFLAHPQFFMVRLLVVGKFEQGREVADEQWPSK